MFGLFLNVCDTFPPSQYESQGYVYPDQNNCATDVRQQGLPKQYEYRPVDSILRITGG